MPIRIPNDLPAAEILRNEKIFIMQENRVQTQGIRPLRILLLNLMPNKIVTETQLLRLLGNTPLQVEIELIYAKSHQAKNTSTEHLVNFYKTFDEIKERNYAGMVITGAPVEKLEYEQAEYWDELKGIRAWSKSHVTSTMDKLVYATKLDDINLKVAEKKSVVKKLQEKQEIVTGNSVPKEKINNSSSWEKKGIRALVLYPMIALVSDQLGRLRNIIGRKDDSYYSLLSQEKI